MINHPIHFGPQHGEMLFMLYVKVFSFFAQSSLFQNKFCLLEMVDIWSIDLFPVRLTIVYSPVATRSWESGLHRE